ncbi:MAG: ATP-binding protein [Planctomycetota bacterium]|nr:ATP-binding protein [Planctomycetota bacterium]
MKTEKDSTAFDSAIVKTPFLSWLERNSLTVVGILLIGGFSVVVWHLMTASEDIVRSFALDVAERQSLALAEFRTLYTTEVVSKAAANGLKVTHDYHDRPDAIPLPATLSMELGSRLGQKNEGHATRLFSDYPFPWRKEGGPKDEFEQRALARLRDAPERPYYEFMSIEGAPVLRYATADLMRESCIQCHNTHPDAPRNDWKLGDVRGVLAVTLPMDKAFAATNGSMRSAFYLMVVAGDVVLLGFAFIFMRIRRHNEKLEERNLTLSAKREELEAARISLAASNAKLSAGNEKIDRARRAALNLMRDMDAARQAANSASKAKSNFLANMSHEIRTPMTAIIGFTELLADAETSQADRTRATDTIHRNGRHLLALINDILDLSRIEAGHMDLELSSCRPAEILGEVRQLLLVRADEKSLPIESSFETPIPEVIQSDELRLRQSLVNLVGNAIKFTSAGSIRIKAACDVESAQLKFTVVDTGIGMNAEQVQRIFEPFSQADNSTTRRFGGTGLGLAISRELAVLLGGGLTVESEPGVGSTFTLTIATGPLAGVKMVDSLDGPVDDALPETVPRATEDADTQPRISKSGHSGETSSNEEKPNPIAGRVLIVEDGPDNQRLVSFLLRKRGATVELADNDQVGLELALAANEVGSPFDLILMDMQMPVKDGYTATRELRQAGYRGQIIALTAHALKEEVGRCLEAGCDAYLRKPIEKPVFFTEIEKRIGKQSELAAVPTSTPASLES